MSIKRQANSELNHENWNDEDPAEEKEMGQFKAASKDVLEKRVIKTARRKNPIASEGNKSVFSGFGGFNKTQPTSFDFLANLTNGSKNTNGSTGASSTETSLTPGLSTNKPSAPGSGLFGVQTSMTTLSSQSTTLTSSFGSAVKTSPTLFGMTKIDSAKETPFKIQPSISSSAQKDSTNPIAQVASGVFGVSSAPTNDSKSLFSSTNTTPFKIQPTSTNTAMVQTSFAITTTPSVTSITPEKKSNDSDKSNEKKIKYFSKLKGLNESVSDWISKHVAQTPLCILSPIFQDYEKYLKEITEEYQSGDKEPDNTMNTENFEAKTEKVQNTKVHSPFAINNNGSSLFTSNSSNVNAKTSTSFAVNSTGQLTTNLSNENGKTSSLFAINNTGQSPLTTNSSNENTSSPFAINNTGPTAFASKSINSSASPKDGNPNQDTKMSSPFAVNSTGSSPFLSRPFSVTLHTDPSSLNLDTKTSPPFPKNNTGLSQLTSPNTKTPVQFGINTGSSPFKSQDTKISTPFGINNSNSSSFNTSPSAAMPKPSLFGVQNDVASSPENKQPTFSFGIKTSTTNGSSASGPSTGFSFGGTSSATNANKSPFSLSANASTNQTSTAPFSFGIGKPFSFSPNTVQQPGGEKAANEETNEEDEPPKVEYTPVKEDNSVYEKKCKIFVKKDGNFVDKGVGTLYIKKMEGNVKHQLLVRANTNLGTVLLNLVLSEGIPTQRMGNNNVMLVCIPTPDAKPPPTPILIRVKTGEEADELLETLNKHKA